MNKKLFIPLFLFYLILIFLSPENIAQARPRLLFGKVTDKETSRVLPFAIIRKLESSNGTMTNNLGYYNFLLEPGEHVIAFSYLGYRSDTIRVQINNEDVRIDIALAPSSLLFPEVMVAADRYNPAERIILKSISNKKKSLSDLKSYEFEAYTKTVMRAIQKEKKIDSNASSKEEKKTPEADSAKNKKDTIIAGIMETQIKGYWAEADKYKEEIIARRQTANFQATSNMLTVGKLLNLNEDRIAFGNNKIIGPTAPDALNYYNYEMIDTMWMNDIMVFRIKMKPKEQDIPLFDGVICIADSTFSIIDSDININKSVQIPFIDSMRYRQQFSLYDKRYWLPVNVRLDFRIRFLSLPPIFAEQVSILSKYRINNKIPDYVFDEYEIKILPYADNVDSSAWVLNQMIPLTEEEVKGYKRIDSIMQNLGFLPKTIFALTRLMTEPNNLPITDISDFIRYNRVEGTFLGFGFSSKNLFDKTRIELKYGYGLSSKDQKYSIGIEQNIPDQMKASAGFSIYKKLDSRDDFELYDLTLNSYLCLIQNFDYYDYYLSKGWRIFGNIKPFNGIKLGLEYREEDQTSIQRMLTFGPLNSKTEFRLNPRIDEGKLKSPKLTFEYDNRKLINSGTYDIPVSNENTITVKSDIEYTDKDILKSDFKFIRGTINIHTHHLTYANGSLDAYLRLGLSKGELPLQKIFDLPSSASGLSSNAVFRTLDVKEFQGDRYIAVFLEHNFGSSLLRSTKIPFIKDQGWDLILSFSAGWTGFSSKSEQTRLLDLKSTDNIFYEAGFSFGNFLPFARLDFAWRLSHMEGKKFSLTIGSMIF
jgi:hypothetical protein